MLYFSQVSNGVKRATESPPTHFASDSNVQHTSVVQNQELARPNNLGMTNLDQL